MPVARTSDPWTSWAAAESLGDLRPRQAAVAAILRVRPAGLTLEELVGVYRTWQARESGAMPPLPAQSDSGIRTRCRELMDAGLVVDSGKTRLTASGRHARVLQLAPQQLQIGGAA